MIPFGQPQISSTEIESVISVLQSGRLVHGVFENFEAEFAKRIGSKYAVAVSSCTADSHLSLLSIKLSWRLCSRSCYDSCRYSPCSGASGATPIFVDVNPYSGNMILNI